MSSSLLGGWNWVPISQYIAGYNWVLLKFLDIYTYVRGLRYPGNRSLLYVVYMCVQVYTYMYMYIHVHVYVHVHVNF